VVITAVVITAATIAAGRSAPAGAAGPVFVESTEGGIVAGGKRGLFDRLDDCGIRCLLYGVGCIEKESQDRLFER
jgi:hypothetical protein